MKIKLTLVTIIAAAILSMTYYYSCRESVVRDIEHYQGHNKRFLDYKIATFNSLNNGFEAYKKAVYYPWRSRIFSAAMAAQWVKFYSGSKLDRFHEAVGFYAVFWIILSMAVAIYLSKKRIFYVGLCALFFGYCFTPAGEYLVYPWDGPIFFVWTLCLFLPTVGKWRYIVLAIIPLAMGVKDTAIILCAIPLLWKDKPVRERLLISGLILAGCIAVKTAIDIGVGNSIFFTQQTTTEHPIRTTRETIILFHNLKCLIRPNSPIFSALILFPAMFFYCKNRVYLGLATAFVACMFVMGFVTEVRLFNELIPLAVAGIKTRSIE